MGAPTRAAAKARHLAFFTAGRPRDKKGDVVELDADEHKEQVAKAYGFLNRSERRALGERKHQYGIGTLAPKLKQARR